MRRFSILPILLLWPLLLAAQNLRMSPAQYEDRVKAAWTGQIAATLMGFQFEHQPAAVAFVDAIPDRFKTIPVDDDWYYEMVAVRAFENYGIGMTAAQLGEQWKINSAGSWGSSEQTKLLLSRGVTAPDTGHPRFNKLWFTIGAQFSADVYGMLAPGMPNVAARLAREFGHVNGYAEGADGAVFMAGMLSLAFTETDTHQIVKKAARLIDPRSPYRRCLDLVIRMAEEGATADQVATAVEDWWHFEYPATNNAVANGGLTAVAVWFGEGDYLRTVNLAFRAADFSDADCNAASAGAVIGAMKGMGGLPASLVERLGDRIVGTALGSVPLTPPVDESLAELAHRTALIGQKLIAANGGQASDDIVITPQEPVTLEAELFTLADLMLYWNPDWKLQRAGFGGAGGGMPGIRGGTYLDGDVLVTYPRDEVRSLVITRTTQLSSTPRLVIDVAADPGRAWALDIYVGNSHIAGRIIQSGIREREWQSIDLDLSPWRDQEVTIRMLQRVLLGPEYAPGNACWRNLRLY